MSNHLAIIQDLKAGKIKPFYLLYGNEDYFIDQITHVIEHELLDEAQRSFDQCILYGIETDVKTIVAEARQFPVLSPYRIVLVKEAQSLKKMAELDAYLQKPNPNTLLCLAVKADKIDGRTKFAQLAKKNHVTFESQKVKDYQLPELIDSLIRNEGYRISPKALHMFAEYVGNDINRVMNELTKLKLTLPKGSEINEQVIEEKIGISKEYNIFELNNALLENDYVKAVKISDYYRSRPKDNPVILIYSNVFSLFQKIALIHNQGLNQEAAVAKSLGLHPFVAKNYLKAARFHNFNKCLYAMHLCEVYDAKSKGFRASSQVDSYEYVRELIYKVTH